MTVLSWKFIGDDTTAFHSALSAEYKAGWFIIQEQENWIEKKEEEELSDSLSKVTKIYSIFKGQGM